MEKKTSEERICELESKYDTQWKVIGVFITIFAIGLGWLWTNDARRQGELNAMVSSQTQMQIQLSQIQNDIAWIKKYMEKQEDSSFSEFNTISKQ